MRGRASRPHRHGAPRPPQRRVRGRASRPHRHGAPRPPRRRVRGRASRPHRHVAPRPPRLPVAPKRSSVAARLSTWHRALRQAAWARAARLVVRPGRATFSSARCATSSGNRSHLGLCHRVATQARSSCAIPRGQGREASQRESGQHKPRASPPLLPPLLLPLLLSLAPRLVPPSLPPPLPTSPSPFLSPVRPFPLPPPMLLLPRPLLPPFRPRLPGRNPPRLRRRLAAEFRRSVRLMGCSGRKSGKPFGGAPRAAGGPATTSATTSRRRCNLPLSSARKEIIWVGMLRPRRLMAARRRRQVEGLVVAADVRRPREVAPTTWTMRRFLCPRACPR